MAFGKRKIGKGPEAPSHLGGFSEHAAPAIAAATIDTPAISRLLVISVAGVVMLASISALFFIYPNRGEPIEVEASLIDGSTLSSSAHDRVVQMCAQEGQLTAAHGGETGDAAGARVTRACECTLRGVVGQLSPLQMQMIYVDYRTKLRATLAAIDRTGERIPTSEMPKLEARDGAPLALVTTASYQAHWREARGLLAQQAARCQL